jgi:hypothetical protein
LICLECGSDNSYGTDSCRVCQIEFSTVPPHVHSNHVCQLQLSIQELLEGSLSPEEFLHNCHAFFDLVADFEKSWTTASSALLDRLAEPLKARYGQGIKEMDQGLGFLREAIAGLEAYEETGEKEGLALVDEKLLHFFSLVCRGCGWVIHELELDELRQIKLGAAADYSA